MYIILIICPRNDYNNMPIIPILESIEYQESFKDETDNFIKYKYNHYLKNNSDKNLFYYKNNSQKERCNVKSKQRYHYY